MRKEWFFMNGWANAVSNKVPHDTIPFFFSEALDRITNIANSVTDLCLLDASHQGFFRDFHQRSMFWRNLSYRIRPTAVRDCPFVIDTKIDFDDIA